MASRPKKKTGEGDVTPSRLIRRWRMQAGYNRQEDAAPQLGVTPQAISSWETGTQRPRPYNVRALDRLYGANGEICAAYGITMDEEADPEWISQLDRIENVVAAGVAMGNEERAELRAILERLEAKVDALAQAERAWRSGGGMPPAARSPGRVPSC